MANKYKRFPIPNADITVTIEQRTTTVPVGKIEAYENLSEREFKNILAKLLHMDKDIFRFTTVKVNDKRQPLQQTGPSIETEITTNTEMEEIAEQEPEQRLLKNLGNPAINDVENRIIEN